LNSGSCTLHHHWPPKVKDSNPRPCTIPTIDPQKSTIRTLDHALHHHWPKKSQRFDPTTMYYISIDPIPKVKDSNPRHALVHHHWPPQSQRFEPTTALRHHWWARKDKDSNPRPCTIHHYWQPPLTHRRSWFWWRHCTHKPKAPVCRNDEKICRGYWWCHCTRKPKAPVSMISQCAFSQDRLENA
jgi:hypothetical protein